MIIVPMALVDGKFYFQAVFPAAFLESVTANDVY
jgi:hypothetical protein